MKKELATPTLFEKATSNLIVEASLTAIAAVSGGALTAMLPILTKSLASERQRLRVEEHLKDVSLILQNHEETLRNLSDAQYKLINEIILASLHTTQAEKLKILRTAVKQSLSVENIEPQEAVLLSRIIRDISAEEAIFITKNFSYEGIEIAIPETPSQPGILQVYAGSRDQLLVSGLFSLGILTSGLPHLGQILGFSSIVAKLIVLLKEDTE